MRSNDDGACSAGDGDDVNSRCAPAAADELVPPVMLRLRAVLYWATARRCVVQRAAFF